MSGGVSGGSQKGSQNSSYSGQTSNTSMPIAPEDWLKKYGNLGNTLGDTGVTTGQQSNIDALKGINDTMSQYTGHGFYGLGDLSAARGGQWATPDAISPQSVNAQTGASFMQPYQNSFDKNVIDSSIADYNASSDRALNGMRAGRDAAGAFGDRAAVGDAVYQADATRGLGSLVSGLRQQNFNTAAGFGQADANRDFGAQSTNASNKMAADTFNNNFTNNRQQFDVNTGFRGDELRMGALNGMQNNILAQNGIQSGGLNNLFNYLGQGTALFGQQNDGTASGTSQGSSSQKSKGGGIGMPGK